MLRAGVLGPDTAWPPGWPLVVAAPVFLAGFALWAWCVWLLARVGNGTLAPWSPTRTLVVVGPTATSATR